MARSEAALKEQAKRAYERGRFWSACRVLCFVVPAIVASVLLSSSTGLHVAFGVVLAAVCIGLCYRGEEFASAVYPGLAAGYFAAAFAIFMERMGLCGPEDRGVCTIACLLAGAIAGIGAGRRAFGLDARRGAFLASTALVAFLAGSLGCSLLGLSGLGGLAIGVAMAAVPIAVLARS